ncbi:hypothetical protein ELI15_14065 [Rhizobium ruizarguesonis]|uniref:hypothetical protein n=1 Tax=Rhizobium ruizarguesonis TaxID=2081791 RepID=UPI00102F413B|nr:hypothetical protein [Rhizobium ruizarguesonis]TAW65415.1 hypothetical protein ELI15_14065 [Rhizobium ruizarguesonis]
MAKLTKKIRIDGYDVHKNEFKISFQLAGYNDHLTFVSTYAAPGKYDFSGNDEQELTMVGLNADDIQQIIEEIFAWVEKPRKSLDGQSHGYMMHSRFDVTQRLEKERRAKAAVERIQVEAPCLDWAMSVTEELVDEPIVVVDSEVQEPSKGKTSSKADGTYSFFTQNGTFVIQRYENGRLVEETSEAWILPIEPPQHTPLGTFFSTPLNDDSPAAKAMRAGMETARQAMEATGLGEEPVSVLDEIVAFQDAVKIGSPQSVKAPVFAVYQDWGSNRIASAEFTGLGEEAQSPSLEDCTYFPTIAEIELRKAKAEAISAELAVKEALFQARRKIAEAATEKAVNVIHTHARRFLTPMSLREHDFLRSIIQEEIERVVGGVL